MKKNITRRKSRRILRGVERVLISVSMDEELLKTDDPTFEDVKLGISLQTYLLTSLQRLTWKNA